LIETAGISQEPLCWLTTVNTKLLLDFGRVALQVQLSGLSAAGGACSSQLSKPALKCAELTPSCGIQQLICGGLLSK